MLPNRAREGQLSMGGRAPPPRKQQAADGGAGGVGGVPGQLPGVQQHQHVPGGRRVSAPARQYLAQQQLQGRRRGPEIFEFPPVRGAALCRRRRRHRKRSPDAA